ncbi:type I secretion membrane protein, ATP binding protein, protein export [Enterobacter cancerogenus]|uniref:Type I secretion membrane protein, ATP binding protein, protein export n=1 Tax=Enterobacter cancerogenus TaxID=69218 RepID=A0A484YXS9_9ENTR|nr:type I secretion membrane protein, ATP binding protein, protein export [Enterobacter cancerogenus]
MFGVTINHESHSPRQLVLEEMARQLGLGMRIVAAETASLDPWRLPMLAEFTGGQIAVINRMDSEGNVSLQFSGDGGLETTLTREALGTRLKALLVLRPLESTPDARVDDYIKPYEKNWFLAAGR